MQKYQYLVSVIIPCFNAEKTIIRTLKSIDMQTINNYQVIIIDDGSTDNSEHVILKYIQNKNTAVRLYKKEVLNVQQFT